MLSLIFTIIFGILIAFFAVQNRNFVDLRFGSYVVSGVPIYLVVLGSTLVTLLFAGVMFIINTVSSSVTLLGKNNSIKRATDENARLEQRIHDLEIENEQLKGRGEEVRTHSAPQFST